MKRTNHFLDQFLTLLFALAGGLLLYIYKGGVLFSTQTIQTFLFLDMVAILGVYWLKKRDQNQQEVVEENVNINRFSKCNLISDDIQKEVQDFLSKNQYGIEENDQKQESNQQISLVARSHLKDSFLNQSYFGKKSISNPQQSHSVLLPQNHSQRKLDIDKNTIQLRHQQNTTPYRAPIQTVSRLSLSKGRSSVFRNSVLKEQKDSMFKLEIEEEQSNLRVALNQARIDHQLFNMWSQNNIQIWLAHNLIPEILHRNYENLKNINDILEDFEMQLKEYQFLKRQQEEENHYYQNSYNNLIFENQNIQQKKQISLEYLLVCNFNKIKKNGLNWNTQRFTNPHELQERLNQLELSIQERGQIDKYFSISGYKLELTRLFLIEKLRKLQKQQFIKELNSSQQELEGYPTIEEFLLQIFVSCVIEYNPYYSLTNKKVMIQNILQIFLKKDTDFYIEQKNKYIYVAHSGKISLKCPKKLQDIFELICFFAFHIKKKQEEYIVDVQAKNAFGELMQKLYVN